MKIRIQIDTLKTLCGTCRWGHVMHGYNGEIEIRCQDMGERDNRMHFAVHTCTEYKDRHVPRQHEYESMAWILRTDSLRKKVGFVAPHTKEHKKMLEED